MTIASTLGAAAERLVNAGGRCRGQYVCGGDGTCCLVGAIALEIGAIDSDGDVAYTAPDGLDTVWDRTAPVRHYVRQAINRIYGKGAVPELHQLYRGEQYRWKNEATFNDDKAITDAEVVAVLMEAAQIAKGEGM